MSDFFATLAGKDDEPADNTIEHHDEESSTTTPSPDATPDASPDKEKPASSAEPPVPVDDENAEEATAVFTMAKQKKAAAKKKKKARGDEPEGQLTIDVYQTDDDIVVKSTIAGVDADDLDISITEDTITVRGEREQGDEISEENYYYRELYWGSFSRSIILPVEVDPDKAVAAIKDGVLTVRVPKSSRSKERKVSVKKG